MANVDGSIDVKRFSQDSYPISSVLKVNGMPVDLTGWTTYLYYSEDQGDGSVKEVRVTGVVNNPKKGIAKFYPRELYCYDINNTVPYRGLVVVGEHPYSIIRAIEAYEQNPTGDYVIVLGEYVAYDAGNPDHDGLQRYSTYTETMTHAVGNITVSSRSGL